MAGCDAPAHGRSGDGCLVRGRISYVLRSAYYFRCFLFDVAWIILLLAVGMVLMEDANNYFLTKHF